MEKSQLIAQPCKPPLRRRAVVAFVIVAGLAVLLIGMFGAWRFRHVVIPYWKWSALLPHVIESDLKDWGNVGQALAGYIALATLGAVIASSGLVIMQLAAQRQTTKTQYQPVVACAALLDYKVEGVKGDARIRVLKPVVKLRFRNLGDSPATFIDAHSLTERRRLHLRVPSAARSSTATIWRPGNRSETLPKRR
jgi:hypothetical protein